jgi:hypothetical protein
MSKQSAADYGQPAWLPEPITHYELASMLQYDTAERVMRLYGDDVLDYLKAKTGYVPNPQMEKYAWCQLPSFFLSRAVLAFAREHAALADYENDNPIDLTGKESWAMEAIQAKISKGGGSTLTTCGETLSYYY